MLALQRARGRRSTDPGQRGETKRVFVSLGLVPALGLSVASQVRQAAIRRKGRRDFVEKSGNLGVEQAAFANFEKQLSGFRSIPFNYARIACRADDVGIALLADHDCASRFKLLDLHGIRVVEREDFALKTRPL